MHETPGTADIGCDLLVFDLDGTLVDSQQDLANAVNETLAHLGRTQLEESQIATYIGDGAALLVRRAIEATGPADEALLDQALAFFLAWYREHKLDFTRPYPDVLAELHRIREAAPALLMAVLTNKPVRPSQEICDGLGLSPFFFMIYGGNSFASKKPDPLGLRTLMQDASHKLGFEVLPSRTVLVGDSHVDAETARAAGIRCIGCTYGLDPERLRCAAPNLLVDSPRQWLAALQGFANSDRKAHSA